jgi:hypothetical protein
VVYDTENLRFGYKSSNLRHMEVLPAPDGAEITINIPGKLFPFLFKITSKKPLKLKYGTVL